eukprot:1067296-Prymnesium_polylepis.1
MRRHLSARLASIDFHNCSRGARFGTHFLFFHSQHNYWMLAPKTLRILGHFVRPSRPLKYLIVSGLDVPQAAVSTR